MNKEFLHMQKLASIITESEYKAKINSESEQTLNEDQSPYYEIGYHTGPNRRKGRIDRQSAEYKKIEQAADAIAKLCDDKDLIDFTKGVVASEFSRTSVYRGLRTVAIMLLGFLEDKKQIEKENP